MSLLYINIAGAVLILTIIWWFWLAKPRARKVEGSVIDIMVDDGVYTPSRIEVPVNQLIVLKFIRKDPSPCAEKVLFSSLGLSYDLPVDTPIEVYVSLPEPGEYEFTCQMQMYRGQLLAR